jgi:hypothetical protein
MGLLIAIWDRPMNVDQCRATVFLHEPLRRSLAGWLGGNDVASMQRCALGGGHLGQHLGVPDPARRGWFRWDEFGFHIGSAERRDYGQRGGTLGPRSTADFAAMSAVPTGKSTTAGPKGGRHAADPNASADEPNTRSPTQALWALTAALERLTDVISAACDSRNSNGQGGPVPDAKDRRSAHVWTSPASNARATGGTE